MLAHLIIAYAIGAFAGAVIGSMRAFFARLELRRLVKASEREKAASIRRRDERERTMSLAELEALHLEASLARFPHCAADYVGGAVRAHHDYERLSRVLRQRRI